MPTYLVTGGAGFIGSNIVEELVRRHAKVKVLDNFVTGRKENLNPKAKFYQTSIIGPEVEEIFKKEKFDYVYHYHFAFHSPAGLAGTPVVDIDNISGAIYLLTFSHKYEVKKIIFASTGYVYGNTANIPTKETEPICPISFYGSFVIAKTTVENYLKFFNKFFGLPYVIFRYPNPYGPRQIRGAMVDYIQSLAAGKQAKIWGDGQKTRDYIYIDDVVRANLLALDLSPNYPDPVFNISTGIETSLNDLYKKIAVLLKREPEPIYLPDRPGEQIRYCLDYSKAKEAMGWKPEYSLDEGLKLRLKDLGLI